MNPTTETVFKTTTAIKKNLELVAKASAYLTFIRNASTGEHLELELGDQLRATSDYNGSIFEVVKKPYWAVVFNDTGTLTDYAYTKHTKTFDAGESDDFFTQKLDEMTEALPTGLGICDVSRYEDTVHEYDSDIEEDEDGNEIIPRYEEVRKTVVSWKVRSIPEGCRREFRVWVRKICLISKAEGLTDDKNFRSLVLTQKTVPFTDLIKQQMDLLQKVSRSLEHTRPTDEKSRKMAGWVVNEKRCSELRKLWWNPALKNKTLTAYSNTKYGLFLRNPVTYTITASGKNVMVQTTDKMLDARKEVAQVAEAKESVVKQLKKGKKDEGCLITDD
jgi:hypothetical protein